MSRGVVIPMALLAACNTGYSCVPDLSTTCTPLYDPTFDNLYTSTLHPTCAQPGASCHSSAGRMGGLVYDDPDTAYNLLLGRVDGRARVLPGNPACSLLVERIEAPDSTVMPPGQPLLAAERCAFVRWIAAGAAR